MTKAANLASLGTNVDSFGDVSLITGVAGTLPTANGGTGQTTYTAYTADTSSIASNGWYKNTATGMIIQWGNFSISAYATGSVTLPTTYPTAQVMCAAGIYMPGNQSYNQAMGFYPNGTSSMSWNNANSGATGTGYFISIGY
jgi:hypothetical protein|tara:strand:+ start:411 stop:836 length:426 start_codon:yes stop_codon:yes gene_type:complete